MLGYRSPVYQEAIWTNFLQMLEHFARSSPPINPTPGQIWLDTGTAPGVPKFYGVDAIWHPIGSGIHVGTSAPASINSLWYNPSTGGLYYYDGSAWINTVCIAVAGVCEYDDLVALFNADALASGQTALLPFPTPPSIVKITDTQWQTLINRIKQLAFTKNVSPTAIAAVTYNNYRVCSDSRCGIVTVLKEYNKLQTLLNSALSSSTINPSCFETLSPPSAGATRLTSWDGTITHTVSFTFADANAASRFFATGGRITWNGQLSSPTNTHDLAWASLLSSFPNATLTSTAFNALTSTDQVLLGSTSGGSGYSGGYSSAAETVIISGRLNSNVLTLTIAFIDNEAGAVSGYLNSQFTLTRMSSVCYSNPSISYPTSSSVGIF
jgi:hypothetical protein